jgi:hypothetical protein
MNKLKKSGDFYLSMVRNSKLNLYFFTCRLQLFRNRKPHVTPEWQQKLPDFVKRLEEALYKNAASRVGVHLETDVVLTEEV